MSKKFYFIFLIFNIIFCLKIFADDPVEGLWRSVKKNGETTGLWYIYIEQDELFGICLAALNRPIDCTLYDCKSFYPNHKIVKDFNKCIMVKTPLIYNLKRQSIGVWSGGHIIDARNGNLWSCNIRFHKANGKNFQHDTLELSGGIGRLMVSQFWEKISTEDANKIILLVIKKNGSDAARKNPEMFLIK